MSRPISRFSTGLESTLVKVVRCEQFIYALLDLYKIASSEGINSLLSRKSAALLKDKDKVGNEAIWIPDDGVVAVNDIHVVRDEAFGREGLWNHTILCRVEDYVRLTKSPKIWDFFTVQGLNMVVDVGKYIKSTDPFSIFQGYFIRELEEFPSSLPQIVIPIGD